MQAGPEIQPNAWRLDVLGILCTGRRLPSESPFRHYVQLRNDTPPGNPRSSSNNRLSSTGTTAESRFVGTTSNKRMGRTSIAMVGGAAKNRKRREYAGCDSTDTAARPRDLSSLLGLFDGEEVQTLLAKQKRLLPQNKETGPTVPPETPSSTLGLTWRRPGRQVQLRRRSCRTRSMSPGCSP